MKFYNAFRTFAGLRGHVFFAPDGEGSGSASYDGSANVTYDNFVLQNQLKDQLATHNEILRYCHIDDSLTAQAGDTVKITVYKGHGEAEDVEEGEGNTGDLSVDHELTPYTVKTIQARFPYTDEQQRRDPFLVESGIRYLGTALTNKATADVVAEYDKADAANKVYTGGANVNYAFDHFVDAVAKLEIPDNPDGGEQKRAEIFALLNSKERPYLQKGLKDDLKYVEAFVRTGYVGTVAGVNVYVNDAITDGEVVVGTAEAVTYFKAKDPETENDRDPNKRINYLYGRQVGLAALTDKTKLALIVRGASA